MEKIYFQWPQSDASFALSGYFGVLKILLVDVEQREGDHLEGCFFPGSGRFRKPSLFSDSPALEKAACLPWVQYCFFSESFSANHGKFLYFALVFLCSLMFTVLLQNNNSIN